MFFKRFTRLKQSFNVIMCQEIKYLPFQPWHNNEGIYDVAYLNQNLKLIDLNPPGDDAESY